MIGNAHMKWATMIVDENVNCDYICINFQGGVPVLLRTRRVCMLILFCMCFDLYHVVIFN